MGSEGDAKLIQNHILHGQVENKLMDKGRISKFNKKFQNLNQKS